MLVFIELNSKKFYHNYIKVQLNTYYINILLSPHGNCRMTPGIMEIEIR